MNYRDWIKDMRIRVRERISDELGQKYRENLENGKYPYRGAWLTVSQIKAVQEYLRTRDTVVFYEVIFLFVIMTAFGLALYNLLFFVFLP